MTKKRLNRKSWIIARMRRLSLKWPPHNRIKKGARRELPRKMKLDGTPYKKPNFEYQCNVCEEWHRSSDVEVDHITPVVDVKLDSHLTEEEFIGKFAVSLFCFEENLQVICIPCHEDKTFLENELRKEHRDKSKEEK